MGCFSNMEWCLPGRIGWWVFLTVDSLFLRLALPRNYRCNTRDACKTTIEDLAPRTITVRRSFLKYVPSQIGSYFSQSYKAPYIGTSYLLSVCCFTPLYGTFSGGSVPTCLIWSHSIGRLADILGRKAAMLLALALFSFGTLLCGIAPSMDALIVARAIAGQLMPPSSKTATSHRSARNGRGRCDDRVKHHLHRHGPSVSKLAWATSTFPEVCHTPRSEGTRLNSSHKTVSRMPSSA